MVGRQKASGQQAPVSVTNLRRHNGNFHQRRLIYMLSLTCVIGNSRAWRMVRDERDEDCSVVLCHGLTNHPQTTWTLDGFTQPG